MTAKLAAALELAAAGLHVIPVHVNIVPVADGSEKRVRPPRGWQLTATTDPETIRKWFTTNWRHASVGVVTGLSGVSVVDADGPEGIAEWKAIRERFGLSDDAPHYRTPGGGEHWWYATDPDRPLPTSKKTLGEHIDTRGGVDAEGSGFVIVPPSGDDRGAYEWITDAPEKVNALEPVPEAVYTVLAEVKGARGTHKASTPGAQADPPFTSGTSAGSDDDAGLFSDERRFTRTAAWAFARPYVDRLAAAVKGSRNGDLNDAARVLAHFGPEFWAPDDVAAHLTKLAVATGLAAHEIRETIVSARKAQARDAERDPHGEGWTARLVQPAEEGPGGQQAPRPSMRARLLSVLDLGALRPATPLVPGLIFRGTLAQLSGPPGQYKSFVALDWALSVAMSGAEPVVYVAAEGAQGMRARVLAWCEHNGVDPADTVGRFYVLPEPVQIGTQLDVTEAVAMVEELGAALLVLDTRARVTVGLEENSSTEQGRAIAAVDTIVAAGATVLVVHHAGRNGGPRGSNAWDGAVWSDLRIVPGGNTLAATVHCEKHKDVPDGCDHTYAMVPYVVSPEALPQGDLTMDEWLAARSTLVATASERPVPDSETGRSVLDIVRRMARSDGMSSADIVKVAEERQLGRSQVYVWLKKLVSDGELVNVGTQARPRYVTASEGQAEE